MSPVPEALRQAEPEARPTFTRFDADLAAGRLDELLDVIASPIPAPPNARSRDLSTR